MKRVLITVVLLLGALFAWNSSQLAGPTEDPSLRLIAHRGVHQTYHRENLESNTCTAERIDAPHHQFLENTLPSIQAAFDAGADVVEVDVHPTTDGHFAVFHDWTIDCRTNGTGVTRQQDLATLQALDIGYGYTADAGKTFPFRGKYVGMMPSLDDVLSTFPAGRFLINFKSRDAREGDMLAHQLNQQSEWRNLVWSAYGGDEPTHQANAQIANLNGWGTRSMRDCLVKYMLLGWSGYVPENCRDTHVMVPGNLAWLLWGWPHRFNQRLADVGSDIILLGPVSLGDPGTNGIDDQEDMKLIPTGFDGYVWTNKIEAIGPELRSSNP